MADARVRTTPFQFRFFDWPVEQGGKPKPATIDTWLYVFHVSHKLVHLSQEVLLQTGNDEQPEMYFSVDLRKHAAKDIRPVVEPGRDCCWLDDNSQHVLDDVGYYILCSPFQLPWRRIDKLVKTKDPATFETLAKDERGLEKLLLDADHTEAGLGKMIRIKSLWSPWGKCQGLSRQYLVILGEWEMVAATPQKQQKRAMLSAIDMIRKSRKGGKLVDAEGKPLLDEAFLKGVHKELLKDVEAHRKVEDAAAKLVAFLKSPAMTAMEDDAMAVEEIGARDSFAEIRVQVEARLSETAAGREYRRGWLEKHLPLVTPDLAGASEKLFKPLRKSGKAIFNWAKSWADVAAGYPSGLQAGQVPTKLIGWTKNQVKRFLNRDLKVVEISPGWSAFDPAEVKELSDEINKSKKWSGVFLLVDTVNLAITMRALFEHSKGDGSDTNKRIAAGTSSICSLMSSAFAYAKAATPGMSPSAARSALSQMNRWKGATKTFGGIGAFADTWSNGADMFAGMHQATVGDSPDRIWLWPGLGMVGSAIACAGYFLAFSNPAGAILVFAGSALAAAGSLGDYFWPGVMTADSDKWLMHSFVGRHRNHALLETDTYTFKNASSPESVG
jgi:hypothetical protein